MNTHPAVVLGANAASSGLVAFQPPTADSLRLIVERIARVYRLREFMTVITLGQETFVIPPEAPVLSATVSQTDFSFGEIVHSFARLVATSAARTSGSPVELANTVSAAVTPAVVDGVDAVVSRVYQLDRSGQIDAAIDLVFDTIDTLLCEDDFQGCDRLLKVVDADKLSIDLLVAVLSITLTARDHLPERRSLCNRVKARIQRERGARAAEIVLKGLV